MKSILIKPLVTEKMTGISEKLHRYGFIVDKEANKVQIKNEVEKLYSVTVSSVNTARYNGKSRSRQTKKGLVAGRTNSFKKAFVTLAKGETIDFFSNI
ncbi:MAG: 50S ribosomal protein L23 [Bacteroidales bacterium]|nr:50S ribosomal protein L23 [Bacteroidales bacterium]